MTIVGTRYKKDYTDPEDAIFKYLSNGSTNEVVGNYATPEIFKYEAPANEVVVLNRLIVFIQDTGNFDAAKYGNGITLTNGIIFRVQDDSGTVLDLTDSIAIKTNSDYSALCYDVTPFTFGVGDQCLSARWTFGRACGPLILQGSQRLEAVFEDDFTGLVRHTFMIQGCRVWDDVES